jgi:hypothetical protein
MQTKWSSFRLPELIRRRVDAEETLDRALLHPLGVDVLIQEGDRLHA